MKYLLDSNTCIRYINGTSESVARRLDSLLSSQVVVCSVVKAELFFGALRSNNPSKTLAGQQQFFKLFVSLPFDDACSVHYGQIRAHLTDKGTPIGGNDMMIAAIARANNLILVTHNTREFSRVPNLELEDWEI